MNRSVILFALTITSSLQLVHSNPGSSAYSFGCGRTAFLCGGLTNKDQICLDHNTVFVTGTDNECNELIDAIKSNNPFKYRCSNGRLLRSYISYGGNGGPGIKTNSKGDSYECQCTKKYCGIINDKRSSKNSSKNDPDDESDETIPDVTDKDITPSSSLTPEEVRGLFDEWNDALLTEDPEIVAKRYSTSPMLLPTLSDVPRTDNEGLIDYFEHFLKKKPTGTILDGKITTGDKWAMDGGLYEFYLAATNSTVKARYTFVYVLEDDNEWRITHHHSSQMPEEVVPKLTTPTLWLMR